MAKSKNKKKGGKRPAERPAVAEVTEIRAVRRPRRQVAKPAAPAARNGRRSSEDVTRALSLKLAAEAELIEDLTLKTAAARKRRDALIVKLSDRGLSEREVGLLAKMTGPRVNQIYHKPAAEAA